jgi:tetratricopeptide (TPR) repeat protein/predicted Ser/Thr protein kinase
MEAGATVGKFTLVERLGSGSTAEVWKAYDATLKRSVAIKFILSMSDDARRRLFREAEALAKLSHPNIVPVFETGTAGSHAYVVMKLVEGPTLDAVVLTLEEKIEAIRQAAVALHYAHEKGILHRDVKPENILIERNPLKAYVTDFGLAKQLEVQTSISAAGAIIGTVQYMPPEQAQGRAREVDQRSDVYSLGASLYELVTGRPVVGDMDLCSALIHIVEEDPKPPGVSHDLDAVILKALEKDPNQRYGTSLEFAEDLGRYIRGEPVIARGPSMSLRVRRQFVRHRTPILATGLFVLIGFAIPAYLIVHAFEQNREKDQALLAAESAERDARWEQAVAGFERVLALDPEHDAARRGLEEAKRRWQEERACLREASDRANREKQIAEFYLQAERELHLLRMRPYRADWKLTQEEFKEFDGLIDRCSNQMNNSGDSAEGWWIIGRVRHLLGHYETADDAYERALKLRPDHRWALLFKARLMLETSLMLSRMSFIDNEGRHEAVEQALEAIEFLSRAVKSGAQQIELDLAKGYAMVVRRAQTKAYCDEMLQKWQGKDFYEEFHLIRLFESGDVNDTSEAIRIRPGFYEAYYWRAVKRQRLNDPDGALRDLTKSLELNPRFAPAYNQRGVMRSGRDPAGAYSDYCMAIESNPNFSFAYMNRGLLRLNRGDYKGAIEDQTRVIDMMPSSLPAYNNRGVALARSGNVDAAIEDWLTAIRMDPQYVSPYVHLGQAYLNRGDFQEALDVLHYAVENDSQGPIPRRLRGIVHEHLADGDPVGRQEHLRNGIRDLETAIQLGGRRWRYRSSTEAALHRMREKLNEY